MSITYYYAPMSTAARTTWAIEELGLNVERVKLNIQNKETKTDAFLKLNPNGVVPLLVVDGTPIFESTAILLYLGETYGVEKGFYPAPGLKRADVMKWVVWSTATFCDSINHMSRNESSYVPAEQHNPKAAEAARTALANEFAVLDKQLEGKEYLVDNKFSFADLAIASYLGWLRFMNFDWTKWKNVKAWGERCMARPACQKAMTEQ